MDLRIPEGKKISKIFTRRHRTNLSASSMSQEKFVAAKTITIFDGHLHKWDYCLHHLPEPEVQI
jgi:hypothetical protein